MRVVLFGSDPEWQEIVALDCVANVTNRIQDISINSYDAIVVCAENSKLTQNVIRYALVNHKHILITQPLWGTEDLYHLVRNSSVICHTAYNYAFDDQILRLKGLLQEKFFGEIYNCRVLAASKNNIVGALTILGPHVLYLLHMLLGTSIEMRNFNILSKKSYASSCIDHVVLADFSGCYGIEVELSTLSIDDRLILELTTAKSYEIVQLFYNPKLLWNLEYLHFKKMCSEGKVSTQSMIEQIVVSEIERLNLEDILIA